jgi:hypothetical protein
MFANMSHSKTLAQIRANGCEPPHGPHIPGEGTSQTSCATLVDFQWGAQTDNVNRAIPSAGTRFLHLAKSRLPIWARLLLVECGNLPRRIRAAREIYAAFSTGSPVLPREFACFAVSGSDSHRRAYTQDMKELGERFPFLTLLDRWILTLAWKAGAQPDSHS